MRRRPWPAREARRLDAAFIRRHFWPFAPLAASLVVFTALMRPFFPRSVWLFALGFMSASAIWIIYYVTVVASGSIHKRQGAWGEDYTRDEIKKLKKDGWTYFRGIDIAVGDIDFVAVGPGGVFVIESKWLNDPPPERWHKRTRNRYLRQARQNADTVRVYLNRKAISVQPRIAVVLWGPGSKAFAEAVKSDYMFHGLELGERIRRYPHELNDAQQAAIAHELREMTRRTGGERPASG